MHTHTCVQVHTHARTPGEMHKHSDRDRDRERGGEKAVEEERADSETGRREIRAEKGEAGKTEETARNQECGNVGGGGGERPLGVGEGGEQKDGPCRPFRAADTGQGDTSGQHVGPGEWGPLGQGPGSPQSWGQSEGGRGRSLVGDNSPEAVVGPLSRSSISHAIVGTYLS